jgi:hypothetical protein
MNIPVILQLVSLIEEIFKVHGSTVIHAAEQAAASTAVETVEQDPKVAAVTEASVALLAAAKSLKTAINASKVNSGPDGSVQGPQ